MRLRAHQAASQAATTAAAFTIKGPADIRYSIPVLTDEAPTVGGLWYAWAMTENPDPGPFGAPEPDSMVEILKELRDELRAARAVRHAPRPWYVREPAKGVLTHTLAVLVALSLGFVLHALTGASITIEAKGEKQGEHVETVGIAPPPATAAPSIDLPSAFAYVPPPPSPPPAPNVKVRGRAIPQAIAAAPAAAPPPAATTLSVPIPGPEEPKPPMMTASPPAAPASAATK
jgi:hypothetical protein